MRLRDSKGENEVRAEQGDEIDRTGILLQRKAAVPVEAA